jgi:mycothiol synthase
MGELPRRSTLFLLWPTDKLGALLELQLPDDYSLRTYRNGDESLWIDIQAHAGEDIDRARLVLLWREYIDRVLPDGLFFAIDTRTSQAVATAGALHNTRNGMFPFGGELGWVASAPAHQGRGLGKALSLAATNRLIRAGYRSIRVGTQDHRSAAIKLYLTLGYVPCLYAAGMAERWCSICEKLQWPFTPEDWPISPPE